MHVQLNTSCPLDGEIMRMKGCGCSDLSRFPVEGVSDDLIETLAIISTEEEMYHAIGEGANTSPTGSSHPHLPTHVQPPLVMLL